MPIRRHATGKPNLPRSNGFSEILAAKANWSRGIFTLLYSVISPETVRLNQNIRSIAQNILRSVSENNVWLSSLKRRDLIHFV